MSKHSLTENKGLSLSQAQSISNLCNQRANEITEKLNSTNNYSELLIMKDDKSEHVLRRANPLPDNSTVINLLKEKSKLHACQAFLMENIKAKETLIFQTKNEKFDKSKYPYPSIPNHITYDEEKLQNVNEEYGWEQLTINEYNDYLEAEAYASHIGQFIHKNGHLMELRNELPTIPSITWMNVKDNEKYPVKIMIHHESNELLELHEELATLHREYEQKVNYYKAKVKNITTIRNTEINKHNAELDSKAEKENNEVNTDWRNECKIIAGKIQTLTSEFEVERQKKIGKISSMRISIDPRFQETINLFLSKIKTNDDH